MKSIGFLNFLEKILGENLFSRKPFFLWVTRDFNAQASDSSSSTNVLNILSVFLDYAPKNFEEHYGLKYSASNTKSYGKISDNTYQWYVSDGNQYKQLNGTGTKYSYLALIPV